MRETMKNAEYENVSLGLWQQSKPTKRNTSLNLTWDAFFLPLPTVGKGLVLKARPSCLETATMLKKHLIMQVLEMWRQLLYEGSVFNFGEHVWFRIHFGQLYSNLEVFRQIFTYTS